VQTGVTYLAALARMGVYIPSGCGGNKRCGRCRVRFPCGAPEPVPQERELLPLEELKAGWRLACAHVVCRDAIIELPDADGDIQDKARSGAQSAGEPFPAARRVSVSLPAPAGDRSHSDRLEGAVGRKLSVPLSMLASIYHAQRGPSIEVTTVGRRVVGLHPEGASAEKLCGLALDVGTTTVAAYLLDLETGEELGARAATNRQGSYGADVVSRISHAQEEGPAGISALHQAIIATVDEVVDELCAEVGEPLDAIAHAVVVGNPAMLHLFAGVDPGCLGQAPFSPAWRRWTTLSAGELGLSLVRAVPVELVPMVSGYVGADVVAGLVACGIHEASEATLYLDLGTNGEIVLAVEDRLISCSAAAGPAFEAVGISCGMSALNGAVSSVEINDHDVWCGTIGDAPAAGLCGTGLTDAVAELLRVGVLDTNGRMLLPEGCLRKRVKGEGNERRFTLTEGVREVYLSQADVRKLQLAKAALRSGVDVLLSRGELGPGDVRRVYLAGAFGAHMRTESLIRIGLLPPEVKDKVVQAGNAAGLGAKAALADRRTARLLRRVARRMEFVELAAESEFGRRYVQTMWFPDQSKEVQV